MAQSLSKLYIHIIFRVKTTFKQIRKEDSSELFAYIGSVIKQNDSIPIAINGVGDHIHILCVMSKNISLSKLLENIKSNSSRWIKTKNIYYSKFSWQGGYSSFSVSASVHDRVKRYIENQEEHHKKMTYHEEVKLFLDEYGIDYNKDYIWVD